jgi:hypothetical protein
MRRLAFLMNYTTVSSLNVSTVASGDEWQQLYSLTERYCFLLKVAMLSCNQWQDCVRTCAPFLGTAAAQRIQQYVLI